MTIHSSSCPGLIAYSSRTGNTRLVAEGISAVLGIEHDLVNLDTLPAAIFTQTGQNRPWLLLGYWVDRGTANARVLEFLAALSDQRIGLFGTIGAYPDSSHADDVKLRMNKVVQEHNQCLGTFLCQGRIDPALIEKFKQFPPEHPHALNEARLKRHADAASHPDETDVAQAVAACRTMLGLAAI